MLAISLHFNLHITISLTAISRSLFSTVAAHFLFLSLNSTQHPLEQDFKKCKETLFTPLAINFFVLDTCEALINGNNFKRTYLITGGVEN